MPSRQQRIASERKAAKLHTWRASLLRARAQYFGTVKGPDERSAEAAAAARFGLTDEQRRRLVVVRAEETE